MMDANKLGDTSLDCATNNGHIDTVKYLLKYKDEQSKEV